MPTTRRILARNVPEPISPRPNRPRAPLHVNSVKLTWGLDTTITGPQDTVAMRTTIPHRRDSADFTATGLTLENNDWRIGVTWYASPGALAVVLEVKHAGFFDNIANFFPADYPGLVRWYSGFQPWPGLEANASNWLAIELTGPYPWP